MRVGFVTLLAIVMTAAAVAKEDPVGKAQLRNGMESPTTVPTTATTSS